MGERNRVGNEGSAAMTGCLVLTEFQVQSITGWDASFVGCVAGQVVGGKDDEGANPEIMDPSSANKCVSPILSGFSHSR